jgi:F-type H+-transporting ATP synthase subunit e
MYPNSYDIVVVSTYAGLSGSSDPAYIINYRNSPHLSASTSCTMASPSPTVNVFIVHPCPPRMYTEYSFKVVRYSALVFGIAYGWYHRKTLQTTYDKHKIERAVHEREDLIAAAKEAYRRQKEARNDTSGRFSPGSFHCGIELVPAVIMDPEDPRFDLEKLLVKYEKAAS